MKNIGLIIGLTLCSFALAGEIEVKEKTGDSEEKSIIIKKGAQDIKPPTYEILTDEDEIVGAPDSDFKIARKNWEAACVKWKQELKENNKDGKVLSHPCGRPKAEKEGTMTFYSSTGKYKLKVKIRE